MKIGEKIIFSEITESTNLMAKENINSDNGTVFLADIQTVGRGRLGRSWNSASRDGLWFSVLLKPDIPPENISQITLVAGLSVAKAIGEGATIKWPNDIIMSNKKVCGILAEMVTSSGKNAVICGIGINVNQSEFVDELKNSATSLYIERKEITDKKILLGEVLKCFDEYYNIFIENGFSRLLSEYKKHCITINKTIKIIENNQEIVAKAIDITEVGELTVEYNGKKRNVKSGEVSVRGMLGYV